MTDVSGSVRQVVYDWLEAKDNLAARLDAEALAEEARTLVPHLAGAWRGLLRAHEPGEDGYCPTCPRRRRDKAGRCAVWESAYRLLIKGELTAAHGGRHALGTETGACGAARGARWSPPGEGKEAGRVG